MFTHAIVILSTLARLINHAYHHSVPLEGVRKLLNKELQWLVVTRVRCFCFMLILLVWLQDKCFASDSICVESALLEGHLSIIVELLSFVSVEERYELGSRPGGIELIVVSKCFVFCSTYNVCLEIS